MPESISVCMEIKSHFNCPKKKALFYVGEKMICLKEDGQATLHTMFSLSCYMLRFACLLTNKCNQLLLSFSSSNSVVCVMNYMDGEGAKSFE